MSEPITKSLATAADIMDAADIYVEVDAPEIGKGKIVRVKCPCAELLEELNAIDYAKGNRRTKGYLVRWAVACVVNEKDETILTPEQAKVLGVKCGKLLERIFYAALNGPNMASDAIEEEAKN